MAVIKFSHAKVWWHTLQSKLELTVQKLVSAEPATFVTVVNSSELTNRAQEIENKGRTVKLYFLFSFNCYPSHFCGRRDKASAFEHRIIIFLFYFYSNKWKSWRDWLLDVRKALFQKNYLKDNSSRSGSRTQNKTSLICIRWWKEHFRHSHIFMSCSLLISFSRSQAMHCHHKRIVLSSWGPILGCFSALS